jgi:exodeoxyribonuclease VIII
MDTTHTDNDAYHADVKRIGKSGLDLIARSPAHYWAKYLDPLRVREEPTKALLEGSFVHCAILEPQELANRYAVYPKIDRRTNAGKEEWNTFLTFNMGKTFIEQSTWDMGIAVAEAVKRHPIAGDLIRTDGIVEEPLLWTMPVTLSDGSSQMVKCKAKPDKLLSNGIIIDPKTTEDARPQEFAKSAFKYRYYVQAAWYYDGHLYATGKAPEAFIFIAVEKCAPYGISVLYATDEVLELGRKIYKRDLAVYAECLRNNVWPTYNPEAQPLTLPAWAYNEY